MVHPLAERSRSARVKRGLCVVVLLMLSAAIVGAVVAWLGPWWTLLLAVDAAIVYAVVAGLLILMEVSIDWAIRWPLLVVIWLSEY